MAQNLTVEKLNGMPEGEVEKALISYYDGIARDEYNGINVYDDSYKNLKEILKSEKNTPESLISFSRKLESKYIHGASHKDYLDFVTDIVNSPGMKKGGGRDVRKNLDTVLENVDSLRDRFGGIYSVNDKMGTEVFFSKIDDRANDIVKEKRKEEKDKIKNKFSTQEEFDKGLLESKSAVENIKKDMEENPPEDYSKEYFESKKKLLDVEYENSLYEEIKKEYIDKEKQDVYNKQLERIQQEEAKKKEQEDANEGENDMADNNVFTLEEVWAGYSEAKAKANGVKNAEDLTEFEWSEYISKRCPAEKIPSALKIFEKIPTAAGNTKIAGYCDVAIKYPEYKKLAMDSLRSELDAFAGLDFEKSRKFISGFHGIEKDLLKGEDYAKNFLPEARAMMLDYVKKVYEKSPEEFEKYIVRRKDPEYEKFVRESLKENNSEPVMEEKKMPTKDFKIEEQEGYEALKAFADANSSIIDLGSIDSEEAFKEAVKKMEEFQNQKEDEIENPKNEIEPEKNNADEGQGDENLELNHGSAPKTNENQSEGGNWLANSQAYWKKWCGDRNFEYVPNENKAGHAFDIYKSEADKKAGKSYGHVHYSSKSNVFVESDSYEVWKGVIEKALKDGQGLSVKNMQSKEDEMTIKMVMVAATIAGAKDKLVGVPEGMVVKDEDLKTLGLTAEEQTKYKNMRDGGRQETAENENTQENSEKAKSIYQRMKSGEPVSQDEEQLIGRISRIRIAKEANKQKSERTDDTAPKSMAEVIIEKKSEELSPEELSPEETKYLGEVRLAVAKDLELPEGENSTAQERIKYLERLTKARDIKLHIHADNDMDADAKNKNLDRVDRAFGETKSFKVKEGEGR